MLGVWVVVGWSLSPQNLLAQSPWIRLVGRNILGITATGLEVAVSYKIDPKLEVVRGALTWKFFI